MGAKRRWIVAGAATAVLVAALAAYLVWSGIRIEDYPTPPRSDAPPPFSPRDSVLVSEVAVPMQELRLALERDVPRTLASIDEHRDTCVPQETVRLLDRELFTTPRVPCDLVGNIRRGPISIAPGTGPVLHARMPVDAVLEVRNIGDVIKRETATARAIVHVRARLDVGQSWQLQPAIDVSYRWSKEPGVDILGQRVRFTGLVDGKLAGFLPRVEKQIAEQIRALGLRAEVETLWRQMHTVESVNRSNPPVWLVLDPSEAGIGRLMVRDETLSVDVMVRAGAALKIGDRPESPAPPPLPPNAGIDGARGYALDVPVLADYAQLEPVVLSALQRLARKGIAENELGRLDFAFEDVEIYATDDGRLAVGVETVVEPVGSLTGRLWGRSRGKVWLTATPVTEEGSQLVSVRDIAIFGNMDTDVGDLLLRVVGSTSVRRAIEQALVEDFRNEYEQVLGKARTALEAIRIGDVTLSFTIDEVSNGRVTPTGAGLFMPASARGSARVTLTAD